MRRHFWESGGILNGKSRLQGLNPKESQKCIIMPPGKGFI